MRKASAIWSPTVKTGLSEVIGSWKIMAMRLPRTRSIWASLRDKRSMPSRWMLPPVIAPGGGTRRRRVSAVTDLPQPDSPTTPRVRRVAMS